MTYNSKAFSRRFAAFLSRLRQPDVLSATRLVLLVAVFFGIPFEPLAHAYLGEGLLSFSASYIIAPVGVIAVVVALAASIFNPQFVKQAVYVALICAAIFLIISNAGSLMNQLKVQ